MPRVSKLRRTPTAPNSKFDAPGSSTLSWSRTRKRQKNWNNPCHQDFKSRSWSKNSVTCRINVMWRLENLKKSVVVWFHLFNRLMGSKFLDGCRFCFEIILVKNEGAPWKNGTAIVNHILIIIIFLKFRQIELNHQAIIQRVEL